MTSGLERVRAVLRGERPDTMPIVPILHAMGARLIGTPIGRYASDASLMARGILAAYERFGYDGVQLSLGAAAEAEALGTPTLQPEDGLPAVTGPLLERPTNLLRLALADVRRAGRLGLFCEAVSRVVEAVGNEAWVVATIRGPLLMATQLRGVEQMLVDLLERPEWCAELMTFTTQIGAAFGQTLVEAGAHAIAIGEATSSPDFIAPRLFREQVLTHHRMLVGALHAAGAEATVMHICGRSLSIVRDVASTGTDVMDIDSQVDPAAALDEAGERMSLRGNIEPAGVLLHGTPALVEERVRAALAAAGVGGRFILGSGCDVPPDTPPENIEALVRAGRRYGASAGDPPLRRGTAGQ